MGANQSRTPLAYEKQKLVIERLRELQIVDQADNEYVHVDEKAVDGTNKTKFKALWTSLAIEDVEKWEHELLQDPKNRSVSLFHSPPQSLATGVVLISNRLALSALSSGDIKSVLTSRATGIHDQQIFNVKIPFEGAPITNQRSSGRCWLFASTNVFRVALMKRHNLDKFELSQAYLFFYDKLEKANFFLQQILDTVDEDLDSMYIVGLL